MKRGTGDRAHFSAQSECNILGTSFVAKGFLPHISLGLASFFIVSKSEIPVTPQYQHESLLYCPGLFRRKNGINDDREVPIDLDARNGKSKRNCPWVGSYFSFLPWGWSESWVKFWFCTSSLRHDQMITQLGGKIIRITEFSDNVPAVPN